MWKILEKCFNESIDKEMGNFVDTVEDRIQNSILASIDSIVDLKMELAIRSKNASSGQDATSVAESSERGEHIGITNPFGSVSDGNNTLNVLTTNKETQNKIPDKVSE